MRIDGKMRGLAQLCGRATKGDDLVLLSRLVELTEFRAGSVVAPAGVAGRWYTRVLSGAVATSAPAVQHAEGSLLVHGPETALVAATDVVLLTVAERDLPAVAALAPALVVAKADRADAAPRPRRPLSLSQAAVRPARALNRQVG